MNMKWWNRRSTQGPGHIGALWAMLWGLNTIPGVIEADDCDLIYNLKKSLRLVCERMVK